MPSAGDPVEVLTAKQVADKLGCTGFTPQTTSDAQAQKSLGIVDLGECTFDGHRVGITTFNSHAGMIAGVKILSGFVQMGGSDGTDEYLDAAANWIAGTSDKTSTGKSTAYAIQRKVGGQVFNIKDPSVLS